LEITVVTQYLELLHLLVVALEVTEFLLIMVVQHLVVLLGAPVVAVVAATQEPLVVVVRQLQVKEMLVAQDWHQLEVAAAAAAQELLELAVGLEA
jgi:hypothetical protein